MAIYISERDKRHELRDKGIVLANDSLSNNTSLRGVENAVAIQNVSEKISQPFQQQSFDGASNETNIAIDFFIKNKDNFFTRNVDIAKAWMEYLRIATPLSEARNDDYINLIEITNIIRTSTEPQVNYNSDIEDSQQFLYEFIRTYCCGKDINSLFQPVVWKSTIYRNLYTKIALQILSSNKELLKRYLIEIVSDIDNLILGFENLKEKAS